MPPFIEEMLGWGRVTFGHFVFMLWWVWGAAVLATVVSEAFFFDSWRQRLLAHPRDGARTVWFAAILGMISPPSRARIFRQARQLLAAGVSPAGVTAYLVAAQSALMWLLIFIIELDGPQPAIGQALAAAAAIATLAYLLRGIPEHLWQSARNEAATAEPAGTLPAIGSGPLWQRIAVSLGGQALSLWWPILFGLAGVGFFLALGQSPAYLSLQGSKGPLVQVGNALVGLLLAYVTGAPLIGNALIAAGLWKAEFVSYAGLSAFYMGTMVMPFVLPKYYTLFGVDLGRRILRRMVPAIIIAALAVTLVWWGLHWTAGLVGVRGWFESFTHSTLRPNDVPWFHHWFQPKGLPGPAGMSGM